MQHQKVSTNQCVYWCLKLIQISPDDIFLWVDTHTNVCLYINCMCGFECIDVPSIVTFTRVKIVQSTQLLLFETIGEDHTISIVIILNIEDKVLINDGSIIMNQAQTNVDTNVIKVVIGSRTSNRVRLILDKG